MPAEINAPLVDSPSIFSIEMLDEESGWAITESQVLRTNDGGVTWYDVTPPELAKIGYGVFTDFLDVRHAWIQIPDQINYPNGGKLFRTSDGGMTWKSGETPFGGGDIAFLDERNGWIMADLGVAAGSNAVSVFQTTDGGNTWTKTYTNDPSIEGASDSLPLGGIKNMILPLTMQTAWIGGVVYAPGTVYLFRTDDGGRIWFKINLVLPPEIEEGDFAIEEIKFLSSTRGFLVLRVMLEDTQTVIYETNDGGNTWAAAPAIIPSAGRIDLPSEQAIIFYGSDQVYISRDAAQTWNIIQPNIRFGESLTDLNFVNSNTGWVIVSDEASHRSLYKTTDGGATWFPLIP